jgi:hypothetical protein
MEGFIPGKGLFPIFVTYEITHNYNHRFIGCQYRFKVFEILFPKCPSRHVYDFGIGNADWFGEGSGVFGIDFFAARCKFGEGSGVSGIDFFAARCRFGEGGGVSGIDIFASRRSGDFTERTHILKEGHFVGK